MPQSFKTILQNVLIEESFCNSKDEAMAIVDSIYLEHGVENNKLLNDNQPLSEQFLIKYLVDYFDISGAIAGNLVQKCHMHEIPCELQHSESSSSSNDMNNDCCSVSNNEIDVMNSDDDSIIGSGACDLCEREDIKLTRHHMIPKSTYNRIESRLVRIVLSDGGLHNESMMENIAITFQCKVQTFADSFDHLLPSLMQMIKDDIKSKYGKNVNYQSKEYEKIVQKSIRRVMKRQTTDICRSCHSMIHKTYDNITLAHQYNTIDKILECSTLYNFFRWNNKQQRRKR